MGEDRTTEYTFKLSDITTESNCSIGFMRIYVAGRVSGSEHFRKKFSDAVSDLKNTFPNAEIINPVAMTADIAEKCPTFAHGQYMQICKAALAECTHIFLIDDWKHSKGAKEEVVFAINHGITILTDGDLV